MPLEEFFNRDRIDIRSLSLDIPNSERKAPFDPEKRISEDEWKLLEEEIKREAESESVRGLFMYLAQARILSPRRFAHIVCGPQKAEKIKEDILEIEKKKDYMSTIMWASKFKIADPLRSRKLSIENRTIVKEADAIEKCFQNSNLDIAETAMLRAMELIVVAPERQKDFESNEFLRQKVGELFSLLRGSSAAGQNTFFSARFAACSRIVFPQEFSRLSLDYFFWNDMKRQLDEYRPGGPQENLRQFFDLAQYLTILAGKKVEMTENGLELTMPNSEMRSEEEKLPERRKF